MPDSGGSMAGAQKKNLESPTSMCGSRASWRTSCRSATPRSRGVAVHEAARVAAAAGAGEILVSQTTHQLALSGGLDFEDRGEFELKGLEGARRLYAVLP
jgi:hypothetical protein